MRLTQLLWSVRRYSVKLYPGEGEGTRAGAERLAELLAPRLQGTSPVIEVNPGRGHLTRRLLDGGLDRLTLLEASSAFTLDLEILKNDYPGRVDFKLVEFYKIWKQAHQDRMDSGERINSIFKKIKVKKWEEDISMTVIGSAPPLEFFRHLITSVVCQDSLIYYGRPEFYFTMLPSDYCRLLTEGPDRTNLYYRPMPVMFNTLFDLKMLTTLPREGFFPDKIKSKGKTKFSSKIIDLDSEYLYLVHITGRKKLPCLADQVPLLWYFFKHHLMNKRNRIIPMLEQWIPSCGVWLITGQDPIATRKEFGPNENDAPLPHITIFTQFSDLSSQQLITLFKRFISWPEFEESPFREALENHMYRSLAMSEQRTKIENFDQEDKPHEQLI